MTSPKVERPTLPSRVYAEFVVPCDVPDDCRRVSGPPALKADLKRG